MYCELSDSESLGAMHQMTNESVCSTCGMKSRRKGNVKRHILNMHKGQGKVLDIMDYLVRAAVHVIPLPSYQRPSGLSTPEVPKKQNPSDIIIQRSFDMIKEILPKLPLSTSDKKFGYRADVCEKCLTHKIFWYSISDLNDRTQHECDTKFILDNPIYLENRDAAIAVLREAIPQYMIRITKELFGPPITLFSWKDYSKYGDEVVPKVEEMIIHRARQLGDTNLLKWILILQAEIRSAKNAKGENKREFNLLKASSINEFEWLRRACSEEKTTLTDEELLQFFSISSSTIATVNCQDGKYWLMLV